MNGLTTTRGNGFLEFAVLVTAVSVLMLAVLELHVSPPTALALEGPAATAEAAATSAFTNWDVTVSSPVDGARLLSTIEPTVGPSTKSVLIDLDARGQEWIGVGGAFTDASVDLLDEYPEAMNLLFDPNRADGAGLNLGRLPLSATDLSETAWTWDWDDESAVATPTEQARHAVEVVDQALGLRSDLQVVATPWTAPATMISQDGSLSATAEGGYAQLLRQQIEWLLAEGAPVAALSLANEPGHVAGYPTLEVSDEQLIRLARTIDPALAAADVELWAVDHNWADRDRVDALLAAGDEFDAAAFHCYEGTPDQMSGLRVPAVVTECTGTNDNWTSTFGWDSRVLVTESIRAGATGLLLWNLALTPNPTVLPGGCGTCRGLLTVDPATGTIERGPEFFTLAHLSRAADPGAIRLETNRIDRLPTVAFINPDGTLGVFGHNDTGEAHVVEIETSTGDRTTISIGPWEMFSIRH